MEPLLAKSLQRLPVVAVTPVAHQITRLTLAAPDWARQARSGHFVNIQVPQCGEVFWRRPFSLHRADRERGTIDILIAGIGRGTLALSKCRPGDTLDVLGLLGNSFPLPGDLREMIVVAGGIGIAPFDLLLQEAAGLSVRKTLFYGARSAEFICPPDGWTAAGAAVHLTTEDGSAGDKGLVLDSLRHYLEQDDDYTGRLIYACGPTPMLAALRELAMAAGIKALVTVENLMACGFGACVGCPVEMAHPAAGQRYLLACKDGPVFPLEEILLNG